MKTAELALAEYFLAHRSDPHPAAMPLAALEGELSRLIEQARRAWPALELDAEAFVEHLARRVTGAMPLAVELGALYATDLYLACACGRGDPKAIAAFESVHLGDLRAVYAQARGTRPPFDELVQVVRAKLFVGEHPKIRDYGGTGELKNWVRVTAARTLVDLARETPRTEGPDANGFLSVPAPDDDPELEYLKRTYHAEVRSAFEDAAHALEPEERNVLREYYTHGLNIDQIAKTHGIHRATAARRVANARDALLRGTRQLMMQRLKLTRIELESIVRLIESQMHVTVERVLKE